MTKRRVWFTVIFCAVLFDVFFVAFAGEWLARSPILRMACAQIGQ